MELDCQRAESLFERLARLGRTLPEIPELDRGAVEASLSPWIRAVSAGNLDRFWRRLSWDRIHPAVAALAFVETSGELEEGWCRRLQEWIEQTSRAAGGDATWSALDPPLGSLLEPWLEEAWRRLPLRIRASKALTPSAWADWKLGLLRRLSWAAGPTLAEALEAERRQGGVNGAYDRLARRVRSGQWIRDWPLLGRHLVQLAEDWIEATLEWHDRLEVDRARLQETFQSGEPGPVVALEVGWSDPHEGGRRAASIAFRCGLDVVYKPRPVLLEAAWFDLLDRLRQTGMPDLPPAALVVPADGYGWMERIRVAPVESAAEVAAWFRCAGTLAALAWVLGARDLHAENLIAAREGPVLVDAEMLLGPGSGPSTSEPVSATGLLADPQRPPAGRAGLEAPEPGAGGVEDRIWEGDAPDELRLRLGPVPARKVRNLPIWEGRIQGLSAWADSFLEGFERGAANLRERGGIVRAWLEERSGDPIRLVFRPSEQYGSVLSLSVELRHLKEGLSSSLLREALLRPLLLEPEKPAVWPLVAEERAALERLDVPVFRMKAGEKGLRLPGGEWVDLGALGPIERAREGLANLDAGRIADERSRLARSLEPRRLPKAVEEARLLAAVSSILQALEGSDAFGGTSAQPVAGLRDLCLYDGLAGRAFVAAWIARSLRVPSWEAISRRLREGLVRSLANLPWESVASAPGLLDGWGGLAWTLAWLHAAADGEEVLEGLRFLELGLAGNRLEVGKRGWDLSSGEAGAVLGALAAWEASGNPFWLERARGSAEALLGAAQVLDGGALAWPPLEGQVPLAGMAHGASGIARALDAFGAVAAHPASLAAAGSALRFEVQRFDPIRGDWAAIGRNGTAHFLAAWCHGAAGILAVRALRMHAGRSSPEELQELERARLTLLAAPLPELDHLCCGTAGRIAALALAGQVSLAAAGDPGADARQLARRALARAESLGAWRLEASLGGMPAAVGLFRGYPGLLWALAAATPAGRELPWLVAFELPGEWKGRIS